ncbi:hypothetical protein HZB90_04385, partial [archaeon]|nr:hypothetical protein [archaeon]
MAFKPAVRELSPLSAQQIQAVQSAIKPQVIDNSASIPYPEAPTLPTQPLPRVDVARVPVTPVIDTPITSSPTPRVPVDPEVPGPRIPVPSSPTPRVPVGPEIPGPSIPVHIPGDDETPTPFTPREPFGPEIPPIHVPIPVPHPKHDLAVTYFASDKTRVAYGEEVNFKFMVKNQGTAGSVTFKYRLDPFGSSALSSGFFGSSIIVSKPVSGELTLTSGESRIVILSYTYNKPCASLVQPRILVDSEHRITESDETNNEAGLKIWLYDKEVVVPPVVSLPDLGIEVAAPATIEVGETADFDIAVINDDSRHTVVTYFNYEFGDGASGAVGPLTLGPKMRVVERVSHVYTAAGRRAFTAMVDPANVVVERVETNNRATVIVDVQEHVVEPVAPVCSDGIDNDQDRLVDLADPGCDSVQDNDETDPVVQPLCNDQLDNDGDGLIDMNDAGCSALDDNDESNIVAPLTECSDGIDNDGDGLIDYPNDPGCSSATDNDE